MFGWLFAVPKVEHPRTLKDIFFWWERRRLAYSIFVCILLLISVALTGTISPGSHLMDASVETVAAAEVVVVANIFYTLGWFVQSVFWMLGLRRLKFGPALLKTGISFSSILLLLPALIDRALRFF